MAVWPICWTEPKPFKLSHWKKIQHVSKLQSILQKWSHKTTHRWEPWSSENVSTRFVMERSHVYRGPQLSVGLNLLIHAMLSIGENQNSLLCTNAGEGNLHYCCGSEQQWAGFQASSGGSLYCCITAFYHSTGHAFQNWCPLLRVEKRKKMKPKGTENKQQKPAAPGPL